MTLSWLKNEHKQTQKIWDKLVTYNAIRKEAIYGVVSALSLTGPRLFATRKNSCCFTTNRLKKQH